MDLNFCHPEILQFREAFFFFFKAPKVINNNLIIRITI